MIWVSFLWYVHCKRLGATLHGQMYLDARTLHPYVDCWTSIINLLLSTASTLLGRFPTTGLHLAAGILLPFRHQSINEVARWCWVTRPSSQLVFQFILKVLDRVDSCMDLALCTGALSCCHVETGEGPSPNSQSCTLLSKTPLYAVVLRYLLIGTKGPKPWKKCNRVNCEQGVHIH